MKIYPTQKANKQQKFRKCQKKKKKKKTFFS